VWVLSGISGGRSRPSETSKDVEADARWATMVDKATRQARQCARALGMDEVFAAEAAGPGKDSEALALLT
jgi:hypothetical protein